METPSKRKCEEGAREDDLKKSKTDMKKTLVPGLKMVDDVIDSALEAKLLKEIYRAQWNDSLKRRTQHFGYEYNYTARSVSPAPRLPEWSISLCEYLREQGFIDKLPDQLIINEYQKGQGISKHVDSPVFGDVIFTVSLGSPCRMIFRRFKSNKTVADRKSRPEIVALEIKPRSFYKMEGEARNNWTHEVSNLTSGRRISLTFRYVRK